MDLQRIDEVVCNEMGLGVARSAKAHSVVAQRLVHKGELSLILVKLIHRLRLALSNNTFLVEY